ncbi:MAG: aldehyde ferredoxin oxidoreductase C-terminal domain-containing protein [Bacteroidota bacterium]
MDTSLKVLIIDSSTSFYKTKKYKVGDFYGPIDLGLHLAAKHNSLNIGVGLLAKSIFSGFNRLIFNGFSPNWGGFYISSMGGAGLVFDNLGINMLSIIGKAPTPSILYLNRIHGEEINVEIHPANVEDIWNSGRGGIYSLMDYTYEKFGNRYPNAPRILATGAASLSTDFGGICSVPIKKGKLTHVDTWAGRGGFGTKLLREHGIAAVIYGGTFVDEDFRDRKVADQWFIDRYDKKMAAKDLEATKKYRFDPKFDTGGTFGVNYATMGGNIMAFNYNTIYNSEDERLEISEEFIENHYLKQFNEETIEKKQQKNCGEPCVAVCKKMNDHYKKDYEPYQTMGPLIGVFDQRAAEKINRKADSYGFDAISVGGVLSWLMECLDKSYFNKEELGVSKMPYFKTDGFNLIEHSMHNADLGIELLDNIINKKGIVDLSEGARKFARRASREKNKSLLDSFVYTAYARNGWMVPNQYWTAGVLSPMPIMGKYYNHYGKDFLPPRELGKYSAKRFKQELILDNMGVCRFHRAWAEEMVPEIVESLYGDSKNFLQKISATASRINGRNSSVFWESEKNIDYVYTFLKRKKEIDKVDDPELDKWLDMFEKDKKNAAFEFWYEIHKGITASLSEFY